MIALPPLLAGAVHETVAWALPGTALTESGAEGAVGFGTTAFEGDELKPSPTVLRANTVNVYVVAAAKPVSIAVVVGAVIVVVMFPGLEMTTYSVMALPPLIDGAVHCTVA